MGVAAMRRATPRRPLLLSALSMAAAPAVFSAQGIEGADAPRRAERWRDLKQAIFGDRAFKAAGDALSLTVPARALDAAAVPVLIALSPGAVPLVRAITLVIDENPAPLAARFVAGPAGDLRVLSTRVRVDAYTFVHAVAETTDGRLLETAEFVKAAGGCSAPMVGNLEAARQ